MADFPAPSPKPPQLSPGLPLVEKPKCRARGSGKLKAGSSHSSHSSHNSLSHIATTATTTIAPPSSSSSARDVVIKTKFPVARIKRIMQADEDVGKVAQVTPVVVSKALELFMIALCDKASTQARQRNSKRITAGHLKQAIIHEDQFDFLADVIAKVPDIPLPAETTVSNNGESGEDNSNGAPPPKKQRKPRQKKIKDENAF